MDKWWCSCQPASEPISPKNMVQVVTIGLYISVVRLPCVEKRVLPCALSQRRLPMHQHYQRSQNSPQRGTHNLRMIATQTSYLLHHSHFWQRNHKSRESPLLVILILSSWFLIFAANLFSVGFMEHPFIFFSCHPMIVHCALCVCGGGVCVLLVLIKSDLQSPETTPVNCKLNLQYPTTFLTWPCSGRFHGILGVKWKFKKDPQ